MTILTKDQLIKDIEAMIRKVADEHGLTYDELLRAWAVGAQDAIMPRPPSIGGVVVNKEKK